ncbi:MAG: MarP family serine protease [Gaiellales bacterium]
MNTIDWIAIGVIALAGLAGLRRGLVASVLSLAGIVAGAWVGSRVAPQLFGNGSELIPVGTLAGAAVGSFVGHTLGGIAGGWARRSLWVVPPLKLLDAIAGAAFGVATGLAVVWIAGTVLLYLPAGDTWRHQAQESRVVSKLTSTVTPDEVIDALGRIDPFLTIVGPSADVPAPDAAIARDPDVRRARESVLRIRGIACGVGIEGSGWIVRKDLIVTNAHVAAGIERFLVDHGGGPELRGTLVAFAPNVDIAVIRVPGLPGRPLAFGKATKGAPAVTIGYPGNGPRAVRSARVGRTVTTTSRDAYGRLLLRREIVVFRGEIHGGSSGGPLVDGQGRVAATVFARRRGTDDGFAVPNAAVASVLRTVGAERVTSRCTG